MKIISKAFEHQQKIPDKYTCKGEGVNPPLQFVGVPENAKSLVLIVDDPDAVGGLFVHWVIYNTPASVSSISENIKQEGIEGVNSGGKNGYYPPCPPAGTGEHRYTFKLYALDSLLELSEGADKKAVEEAMNGHVIEKAEIIGLYSK